MIMVFDDLVTMCDMSLVVFVRLFDGVCCDSLVFLSFFLSTLAKTNRLMFADYVLGHAKQEQTRATARRGTGSDNATGGQSRARQDRTAKRQEAGQAKDRKQENEDREQKTEI